MTEYLTEQEQIEILKNWIKQYSVVIFLSVVLTIIVISGWRYWQERENRTFAHASVVYDDLLTMRARNDADATAVQAQKLLAHYNNTVYGDMAELMLARNAVNKKDYAAAEKHLRIVMKNSKTPSFRQIARIRLARVLMAEQKPQDGINILGKIEDKSFNGLTDEVKGDAYLAMKNYTMAKQSYQLALTELPNAEAVRPLLQMKYDNVVTTN